VQVVRGEYYRTRRSGKTGMIFTFQTLAGLCCPAELSKFWSVRFCKMISGRIGFSKPWGARPFQHMTEFVNLRMYVLVSTATDDDGKPVFSRIAEKQPSSVLQYNQTVLRWRQRLPDGDFKCPYGYPAKHRCFQCHVGLEDCPAATHEYTFVKKHCQRCEQLGWHDPANDVVCAECLRRSKLQG
jgi:hypothetical protein